MGLRQLGLHALQRQTGWRSKCLLLSLYFLTTRKVHGNFRTDNEGLLESETADTHSTSFGTVSCLVIPEQQFFLPPPIRS